MSVATVELILFGIQAGVQLAQTGRRIYVEATIGGVVDVPLPIPLVRTPFDQAVAYGKSLRLGEPAAVARFERHYQGALAALDGPEPAATQARFDLLGRYAADIRSGLVPDFSPSHAQFMAVAAVRQFPQNASPFPSPVQRVAGTLINIAVDYFANVPGAVSEHSRNGKAVRQFLLGLSAVDFADARIDQIVVGLFSAALDTLKDNPGLIVEDDDAQALVTKIVSGVVTDIDARLKADGGTGSVTAEDRLARYGKVVLRSLLKNAGQAVVDDPSVLGLERGGKVLVQSVGSAFLNLLLADDGAGSLGDGLRRIASTEGLDKLIGAALRAVAEHPDFFGTGNAAVDKWLTSILTGLQARAGADDKFLRDPALLADVAYMAVEYGLRDLPVLLKTGASTAGLIVDVAGQVFDALAEPPGPGKPARWKVLNLSRSDVKDLLEGVFVSLALHNEWLVKKNAASQAAALVPVVVRVLAGLVDGDGVGYLKPLLRADRLDNVLAAVLASGVFKATAPPAVADVVAGVSAVLDMVWDQGAAGADRLLDPDVLLDVLTALARGGAAGRLFGGDAAKVDAVVALLVPVFKRLRDGEVLPVGEIVAALAA